MAMEQNNVRFSSFFRPSEVLCQTQETSRDIIVMDMLRLLARRCDIGAIDEVFRAVIDREKDLPTIVAPGMAMPHARLEAVPEILAAVATSNQGIVYDPARPDDHVKLIILTLAPKASPGAYLQAISCVATICRAPSTAELVASLPTADQVWSFFDKGTMPSAAPAKNPDTSGAELR
jgi:mannitol/fructose-specific phosphotransferase system IIA component (Ntr-type)